MTSWNPKLHFPDRDEGCEMRCQGKATEKGKKKSTFQPEMIMLKFGNVWVSSVTNSIMNTKRISIDLFFVLEVLSKISIKKTC